MSLDDLHDYKANARLAIRDGDAAGPASRRFVRDQATRLNRRHWRNYQRRICASVDAVAVCSELDRDRLASANVRVVPNIYPAPPAPLDPYE